MSPAFFETRVEHGREILVPGPSARSLWGAGSAATAQVRGMAVSGALARAAERTGRAAEGGAALHPARWVLDLFRPTRMRPVTATASVVRRGRRLCLVDAVLTQDDQAVARASALFLARGGEAAGVTWAAPGPPAQPPPPSMRPEGDEPRLYYSESVGWTASAAAHANASRKQTWHFRAPVVAGEEPSPFQQAAMVADVVNVVTNWGDAGVQFINTDVSLALARLPRNGEVGLRAEQRIEADGVVAATASLFDRSGTLGSATITALANGANAVDPRRFGLHVLNPTTSG